MNTQEQEVAELRARAIEAVASESWIERRQGSKAWARAKARVEAAIVRRPNSRLAERVRMFEVTGRVPHCWEDESR